MKRTWKTICGIGTALCLLIVTQAVGQQPGAQQKQLGQKKAGEQKICLASKVTEMMVKDKSNQNVGQIKDLVIDAQGQVKYLAIDTKAQAAGKGAQPQRTPGQQPGQRAGQGAADQSKLTLVPFDAVEIQEGETEAQSYVSLKNIDKDRLTQAPSFTRQQLTAQAQQAQWMSQVDRFFQGAARPELNNKEKQQQPKEREE